MENRNKNSLNNQSFFTNKNNKEVKNNVNANRNNKTINKTGENSKSAQKSFSKQPFQNRNRVPNSQNKQGSVDSKFDKFNNFNSNHSKDDDLNVDLSHRSKPRDWKKQQKKPELEIMDMNMGKVERQTRWEEKKKKEKSKDKKFKNKHDKFNDYDDDFNYENDGWN